MHRSVHCTTLGGAQLSVTYTNKVDSVTELNFSE